MTHPVRAQAAIAALVLSASLASTPVFAAGSHAGGLGPIDFGGPGKASQASRTVKVTMGDTFFEPERISVVRGETVRFAIKNEGKIVHEFNIGTAAMHAAHQKEMMMMVEHGAIQVDSINHDLMKMDMGGGKTMMHDDPNSVLLEPGKSAEIVWTFAIPMELEFACNVPGHYDAGMAGMFEFVNKLASR
jgi:uncharacterized cupredoxin-like copper-binding protein